MVGNRHGAGRARAVVRVHALAAAVSALLALVQSRRRRCGSAVGCRARRRLDRHRGRPSALGCVRRDDQGPGGHPRQLGSGGARVRWSPPTSFVAACGGAGSCAAWPPHPLDGPGDPQDTERGPRRAGQRLGRCTSADLPMICVLAGLALYTVLGGADFGAGIWQLTYACDARALTRAPATRARGATRARPPRHGPGVGGQPRLAHLRVDRDLDRLSAGLWRDHLDPGRPPAHRRDRRRPSEAPPTPCDPGTRGLRPSWASSMPCSRWPYRSPRSRWARWSAPWPRDVSRWATRPQASSPPG